MREKERDQISWRKISSNGLDEIESGEKECGVVNFDFVDFKKKFKSAPRLKYNFTLPYENIENVPFI